MACYTPGGSDINELWKVEDGDLYAPCNTSAPVSMCCAIGRNRTSPDVCIANGFCHNAYFGDKDQTWRESCTDPTWKDPACIKLFVNGTGINATMGTSLDDNGNKIADILITLCDDGSYCYGDNNRECCRQGQGVFVLNGEQVFFNPSATSSTSSSSTSTPATGTDSPASSSGTQESATTPSPTASSDAQSGGLSTGAKVGIGIGVGLAAVLVLGLLAWFFRRKRRNNIAPRLEPKEETDYPSRPDVPSKSTDLATMGPRHQDMSELHADSRLDPHRERFELGDH